jgi:hypothetical protein
MELPPGVLIVILLASLGYAVGERVADWIKAFGLLMWHHGPQIGHGLIHAVTFGAR